MLLVEDECVLVCARFSCDSDLRGEVLGGGRLFFGGLDANTS